MKCKEDNHCEQDWYISNYKSKDIIRIKDTENFVVEYDKSMDMYRVSYFEDNHFVDEICFSNAQTKKILNYIIREIRKYDNNPFGIPLTIRFLEEAVKLPDDFMKRALQDCE